MRPFGAIEACEVAKIFIVNSGCTGVLEHSIPNTGARGFAVLQFFQVSTIWKTNENDFASTSPKFLYGCGNVLEALVNCVLHRFGKFFFRNVSRWRRRSEKRDPGLLNHFRQFTARLGAFFGHARATFAIQSSKVRRKSRRYEGIGTIWDGQTF